MPAFFLAQRALAAAASLARVAADIRRRPPRATGPAGAAPTPMIEVRSFSRASIFRRIEMASCKALADVSTVVLFWLLFQLRRAKASMILTKACVRCEKVVAYGAAGTLEVPQPLSDLQHAEACGLISINVIAIWFVIA